MAATRTNFFEIHVNGLENTHMKLGYRTRCGSSQYSETLDLRYDPILEEIK